CISAGLAVLGCRHLFGVVHRDRSWILLRDIEGLGYAAQDDVECLLIELVGAAEVTGRVSLLPKSIERSEQTAPVVKKPVKDESLEFC
ncbi:MAG: hypothetical protein IH892_02235, partial [Planctomycetes bacterium]|nr:hypothetical protein [Planctomycetota bacterium]